MRTLALFLVLLASASPAAASGLMRVELEGLAPASVALALLGQETAGGTSAPDAVDDSGRFADLLGEPPLAASLLPTEVERDLVPLAGAVTVHTDELGPAGAAAAGAGEVLDHLDAASPRSRCATPWASAACPAGDAAARWAPVAGPLPR